MMDLFIELLKASGADAWEIIDTKTEGWEFYFIRHKLDQNRAKDVEHITLKVYKKSPDGNFLGTASAEVSPTETREGLEKIIENLVYQASLVKNKPYTLNPPVRTEPVSITLRSLKEEAADFIRTMNSISETETEYLNSYEIFVNQTERRLINSEGIDVTEHYPSSMLDVVVNARNGEHEIELYRLYEMGSCDAGKVKEDIEELLKFGKDRLVTKPTPVISDIPVLFSTDAALSIYSYFLDNLNAALLVRGISSFKIGEKIAENIEGDSLTIESVRILPGSPACFTCDVEGAPIRDAVLLKESVPMKFVGGRMFSQYLGLTDSFNVSNWKVSGGTRKAAELRTGRFLEVVEFSDFQVDGMTGDIFGEIRLAYYHDGTGASTPVSGGSISGNMTENLSCMYMSKETRQYSNAVIPAVTRLDKLTVSGVEQG